VEGSTWAGEHGLHFVTLGSMQLAKENIDAFKAAFAKRGRAAHPKPEFSGGVAIGVQRHIFVDETDEKARAWAKPAMEYHLAHINWLRTKHGQSGLTTRLKIVRGANYEECVEEGSVIAGSPATVLAEIERHVVQLGINYLLAYLFLGNMAFADAQRSLKLFCTEIMPNLARL
jgi:alkanesulfonate monooxygenase SsuD/methylene tetrahydromethanopterin reductase-like flavin-dependent oxidoreductase (luciferase family)